MPPLSNKISPVAKPDFVNVLVPALIFPPIFNVPAIPAPPSTINAPVVVLVETNAEVT